MIPQERGLTSSWDTLAGAEHLGCPSAPHTHGPHQAMDFQLEMVFGFEVNICSFGDK